MRNLFQILSALLLTLALFTILPTFFFQQMTVSVTNAIAATECRRMGFVLGGMFENGQVVCQMEPFVIHVNKDE